jgi:hypothetical protein
MSIRLVWTERKRTSASRISSGLEVGGHRCCIRSVHLSEVLVRVGRKSLCKAKSTSHSSELSKFGSILQEIISAWKSCNLLWTRGRIGQMRRRIASGFARTRSRREIPSNSCSSAMFMISLPRPRGIRVKSGRIHRKCCIETWHSKLVS